MRVRRIDKLKAIAFDRGFTNEDAKRFGKLSKTATWEALLAPCLIDGKSFETAVVDSVDRSPEPSCIQPVDSVGRNPEPSCIQPVDSVDRSPEPSCIQPVDSVDTIDWTNDGSFPVCNFTRTRHNSTFLDWVDFGQLIALVLASAGVFVLAMSMWGQINPLNLFPPIRINIQIGAKP